MLTTYTPLEYLMIDLSNHYGNDKLLYEQRIDWVDAHHDRLEDLVDEAEKPELYLAAVLALRAVERGCETGHLVEFDAAASGPAIMGALIGCFITAQNTGLIGKVRGDLYTTTTKAAARILGASIDIARDDVKDAQMPWCYGSEAKPKEILGDGTPEYCAFFEAMQEVMPGAYALRNSLVETWIPFALYHDWYMADGYYCYCPVMAPKDSKIKIQELGAEMSITYRHEVNAGCEEGLSNAANLTHSVDAIVCREMGRRCNFSTLQLDAVRQDIKAVLYNNRFVATERIDILFQESGFMSLVGVEYITSVEEAMKYTDSYLMALLKVIERTIERDSFDILFIHDAFKCHANHVQTMRQTYVEIMAEIADSTMLQHILSQILNDPDLTVNKLSDNLAEHILEGEYSIC
jgi:hypothetical protein